MTSSFCVCCFFLGLCFGVRKLAALASSTLEPSIKFLYSLSPGSSAASVSACMRSRLDHLQHKGHRLGVPPVPPWHPWLWPRFQTQSACVSLARMQHLSKDRGGFQQLLLPRGPCRASQHVSQFKTHVGAQHAANPCRAKPKGLQRGRGCELSWHWEMRFARYSARRSSSCTGSDLPQDHSADMSDYTGSNGSNSAPAKSCEITP